MVVWLFTGQQVKSSLKIRGEEGPLHSHSSSSTHLSLRYVLKIDFFLFYFLVGTGNACSGLQL